MGNEQLIDILNKLVDVGLKHPSSNSRELAFDFINIKLRYQMRKSGMTGKEIIVEMDKIMEGNKLRQS